jgi:periplasmic protein TonB
MPTRAELGSAGRRASALALVIVAHLGVVAAFVNGLGGRAVQPPVFAVQVSIIRSPPPPPPPPPQLPRVQLQALSVDPAVLSVPPVIHVDERMTPLLTGTVGPPRVPVFVPIGLLSKPDTDPYYPPEAARRHLSGHTLTRVCIDTGAQLASVQVVQSSGFPEFDNAAVDMVHHMLWRAATLDGKAISDCRPLLLLFLPPSQQHGGRAERSRAPR